MGTFEPYTGEVYSWAYRLLGRHHDALDVVQDVFLKWTRQCKDSLPDHPRSWLRRVTMNQAIDLIRRHGRNQDHHATISAAEPASHQSMDCVEHTELRHDIALALDRLTDMQRGVLIAKIYDEMTFARIADEMSLAVSTVKTHYLRAIRVVRDRLQRHWLDEE